MNAEIKTRIEMINKGEVPEGYKETKVGIIPEDWEVKRFGEEFKVNQGLQIPIKERYKKKVQGSYIYITNDYINNLNNNYEVEYIKDPSNSVICNSQDILMTRTGNTGIVVSGIEGVFHNNFFKVKYDEKKHCYKFLVYLLKSSYIQHNISRLAGTSTIPDLTHSDFYSLESLFPSLPEQQKIAQILSTWDQAIELKEKLIEEKKEQKKGLMQKLLTGEVRLSGFDGEWEEVRMGDLIEEVNERTTSNNQYPVLTSSRKGIFLQDEYFSKQIASTNNIGYKIIKKGEFTYRTMSDDGEFTFNRLQDYSIGIVSPAYVVFKAVNIDSIFLRDLINSHNFNRYIVKVVQGGTRLSLRYNQFKNIIVSVPSLQEQKAIANILSTADKEIDLLNQELEQLKGLMQLLLTGIIRVKS